MLQIKVSTNNQFFVQFHSIAQDEFPSFKQSIEGNWAYRMKYSTHFFWIASNMNYHSALSSILINPLTEEFWPKK